jgi:hypothetical protein
LAAGAARLPSEESIRRRLSNNGTGLCKGSEGTAAMLNHAKRKVPKLPGSRSRFISLYGGR